MQFVIPWKPSQRKNFQALNFKTVNAASSMMLFSKEVLDQVERFPMGGIPNWSMVSRNYLMRTSWWQITIRFPVIVWVIPWAGYLMPGQGGRIVQRKAEEILPEWRK